VAGVRSIMSETCYCCGKTFEKVEGATEKALRATAEKLKDRFAVAYACDDCLEKMRTSDPELSTHSVTAAVAAVRNEALRRKRERG